MNETRIGGIALFAMLAAAPVAAQQVPACEEAEAEPRSPDLIIRASASADRVRFESDPEIDIRLTGCGVLDSVRVTERRNLPDRVEPGVTYEDVSVAVEILGHLDIVCVLDSAVAASDSLATALQDSLGSLCTPAAADTAGGAPRQ